MWHTRPRVCWSECWSAGALARVTAKRSNRVILSEASPRDAESKDPAFAGSHDAAGRHFHPKLRE